MSVSSAYTQRELARLLQTEDSALRCVRRLSGALLIRNSNGTSGALRLQWVNIETSRLSSSALIDYTLKSDISVHLHTVSMSTSSELNVHNLHLIESVTSSNFLLKKNTTLFMFAFFFAFCAFPSEAGNFASHFDMIAMMNMWWTRFSQLVIYKTCRICSHRCWNGFSPCTKKGSCSITNLFSIKNLQNSLVILHEPFLFRARTLSATQITKGKRFVVVRQSSLKSRNVSTFFWPNHENGGNFTQTWQKHGWTEHTKLW